MRRLAHGGLRATRHEALAISLRLRAVGLIGQAYSHVAPTSARSFPFENLYKTSGTTFFAKAEYNPLYSLYRWNGENWT